MVYIVIFEQQLFDLKLFHNIKEFQRELVYKQVHDMVVNISENCEMITRVIVLIVKATCNPKPECIFNIVSGHINWDYILLFFQ